MKKIIMIAVMAMVAFTANAQFSGNIHAGAGYTNLSNSYGVTSAGSETDLSSGLGYTAGIEGEYRFTEVFGVSAGLDFLYNKSKSSKVEDITGSYDFYNTQSFLSIPVLAQCHFGSFGVKAGVQPSFLLSMDGHSNGTKSYKDKANSVLFSIPVGISYDIDPNFVIDLRCAIPVTDVWKKEVVVGDKNSKFLTVMLTAGYRF